MKEQNNEVEQFNRALKHAVNKLGTKDQIHKYTKKLQEQVIENEPAFKQRMFKKIIDSKKYTTKELEEIKRKYKII